MDSPWFYCPTLHAGELFLSDAEMRHAQGSRRLRAGDVLTLFDGAGHVARGTLVTDTAPVSRRTRGTTHVRIEAVQEVPPPSRTLTLITPGCKGARLEWLVEKGTELGVARLVLAEFERSVVRVGPQHVEKLRRTAIEACKQCRRAWRPEITSAGALAQACADAGPGVLLVAHPDGSATALARCLSQAKNLVGVIGPEGGLTAGELEYLRSRGGELAPLGAHILRVETAALAVAACWAAHSPRPEN